MDVSSTQLEDRTVFVLGAGFTRAFLPDAPLLVDDFDGDELLAKYSAFPHASRVLRQELDSKPKGKIDLERLMTRLDSGMPYDSEHGAAPELTLLLSDLKGVLARRLGQAKKGSYFSEDLLAIAKVCVERSIPCLTFNYDDAFDEQLWRVHGLTETGEGVTKYWHPDGGYGFFCRPAELSIRDSFALQMDRTSMLLLKLHGSVNWRPRRGAARPYSLDAILHYESWLPLEETRDGEALERHLEREAFIVPPVLSKDALIGHPVLRLVWSLAFDALRSAQLVVFLGYSLPVTDIAASFLFGEAISRDCRLHVVDFGQGKLHQRTLRERFRRAFPSLRWDQFDFAGARNWCTSIVDRYTVADGNRSSESPPRQKAG